MQAIRVLLYGWLCGIGFLMVRSPFSGLTIQVTLAVLFVIGVAFELYATKHRIMVLPPALFTAFTLVNNMVAGIWHFAADRTSVTQWPTGDDAILRGTWYSMVAVQVLWIAFSSLPEGLLRLRSAAGLKRVPGGLIFALIAVSLTCFVLAVRLGTYGYVADVTNVNYVTYLRFGVNLGWLAIILLATYEWENSSRRMLLYAIVVLYFFIGLLFGSKSTAVLPVALTLASLYAAGHRIRLRYLAFGLLAVAGAYAVVEPFRLYYSRIGQYQDSRSVTDLARMYTAAGEVVEEGEIKYLTKALERQNHVNVLATVIEFADNNRYYRSQEWRELALSPLYGVIPRFIWRSKPLSNFNSWASVNIFGLSENNSVGVTPQGHSYLVARLGGIVVFFFVFGVVQRLMFNLLFLNRTFLPLYLLVYFEVGYPMSPWTFVAGMIQVAILLSPLMLVLMWLTRERKEAGQLRLASA